MIDLRRFEPHWLLLLGVGLVIAAGRWLYAQPPRLLDPTGWGSDHVGRPVAEFATGDECLFCHRMDVGATWAQNRHGHTIREAEPRSPALEALRKSPELTGLAGEVELLLGGANRQRFLKRGKEHGKLDLLSVEWQPSPDQLIATRQPRWDSQKFADACAGCHATGVDAKTHAFAAMSIDCYSCHGEIVDKHTREPALAHLSKKRREPAREVISICAQCHIRTGTAKSTGLPYPNNFVAGDNLFRDYQADLSEAAIRRLNPGDAHVLDNIRDVVLLGKEDVTCLSCHTVHRPSGKKHHRVAESRLCLHCHKEGTKKDRPAYEVHSARCGY